jgi:RHS repeat-associated protein
LGQRDRTDGTLRFLLGDHLGSSSVTTDANGVKTASALYKAFGETRYTLGNLGTDYHFTGQREESALGGIYWFQSRWFDPTLGRFTSPDTIVPAGTQGTQAWDRYAFVNNNPVRYTDPTGHFSWPFPAGNVITLNFALGISVCGSCTGATGAKDFTFLLYGSISLVTDHNGGVQLYTTTRDQNSPFDPGPAEQTNPSTAMTAGASLTYGIIEGSDFEKRGTLAYEGLAVDNAVDFLVLAGDQSVYADPVTGQTDPSELTATSLGVSIGSPIGLSSVATRSEPLFGQMQLSPVLTDVCQAFGMCGSYSWLADQISEEYYGEE